MFWAREEVTSCQPRQEVTFLGGSGTPASEGLTGSVLCVVVGHVRQNPQRGETTGPTASEGTLQP